MYSFRSLIFSLGLVFGQAAYAQSTVGTLEQDLVRIDQFMEKTQADLQTALEGYDQAHVRAAGSRMRELKQRRERITTDLAAARELRRRNEAAALQRIRPELARRLEAIEPQVDQAAAAFDERHTPSRGGTLRTLSMEEIELLSELETADSAPKEGATKDATDDAVAPDTRQEP